MALTIDYQNFRGLRTKTTIFRKNLVNSCAKVIAGTETWLNNNFFDSELTDGRYKVFRRDRPYANTNTVMGGGSILLVKKDIIAVRMTEFESNINFVEDLWLQLLLPDGYLYICIVYITSKANNTALTIDYLKHLENVMLKFDCNDKIIILGDFNIRNIDWIASPDGSLNACNVTGEKAIKLCNTLNVCSLQQHSSVRNRDLKSLDLVLSSEDIRTVAVIRSSSGLVPIDVYHPPTTTKIKLQVKYLEEIEHRKLNYRKADYELLSETIKNINWDFIGTTSTDNALSLFYDSVRDIIRSFVPQYKKKNRHPFWFSSDLIKLLKQKEKLRQKWKKNETQENYSIYSDLRAQCKTKIAACHKHYIEHIQRNIQSNIKLFWAYSKSKRKTNSYPSAIQYQNTTAMNPRDISETFATYFQTTFTNFPPYRSSINTLNEVRPNIVRPIITKECVANILSKLDENKNGGPDGIPSLFWKKLSTVISHPLSLIFNKSLEEGVFPDTFKEGFVTPIYKSGDQSKATNYRPVCLLNTLALVFEKCVLNLLQPQIIHLISKNQHGFTPGRSTNSNLVKLVDYISNVLDDQGEVHCVYTDFSKAFDSVNHDILVEKLKKIGLSDSLLKWFKSYLSNRKLRVTFGGDQSNEFTPPSGVPQGSVLGPFLFNIFINDLTQLLRCPHLLFADDLKIYLRIRSFLDSFQLQTDLDILFNWCLQNGLSLNINKCCFIVFSNKRLTIPAYTYHINHMALVQVENIKDLGVIFDSKLKFDKHIEWITNKAYKMLGFIARLTHEFSDINCVKLLYNTLVRSHLEYCTSVWNPYSQKQTISIERVQKKFTRLVYYRLRQPCSPYSERLSSQQMNTLEQRRIYYDLCVLHYVFHDNFIFEKNFVVRNNFYPNRVNITFIPPKKKLNYGRYSPSTRMQYTYNSLFASIDPLNENKNKFKKILKRKLNV